MWFKVGPGTEVCIPGRVDLGYAGDEVAGSSSGSVRISPRGWTLLIR